ncbi:MAG: hypothetical protein L0Y73_04840 [Candidatus Aminicenantes bacterium]|nr:hypothetical protein [Candidatus Aminicenantes bacterium]
MDIFINNSRIAYQPLLRATWGSFLKDLQEEYIEKNHGIVRILLDRDESSVLTQDRLDAPIHPGINVIEIFTRNIVAITSDGFIKILELTDSVRCEIPLFAEYYRKGQIKKAADILKDMLGIIKSMIDFVNSVGINFSLNFDEILIEPGTPLKAEIESFKQAVSSLVNMQQKENNPGIADFLEQRFIENLYDWNRIIKKLLNEVKKRSLP